MAGKNGEGDSLTLRFALHRGAHPELVDELIALDVRARSERMKFLAALGQQMLRSGGRIGPSQDVAPNHDQQSSRSAKPAGETKSAAGPSQIEKLRDIEASELEKRAQVLGKKVMF